MTAPFETMGTIYRLVEPPDVILVAEHFGETNVFELDVRLSVAPQFARTLTGRRFEYKM